MSTVRDPRQGNCTRFRYAEMAELVDALASGASGGNPVEVQVLFSAPNDETAPDGAVVFWQAAGGLRYAGPN